MSMDLHVIYDGAFPGFKEWQKAIDRLQFNLIFSEDQVMTREGGVIRGLWKDRAVSFECRPSTFQELTDTYDDIEFGRRWTSVQSFYWIGLPDCVAASIAAAALAQLCDGIVFDPQESLVVDHDAAAQMARENEVLLPKIEASLLH